MAFDTAGNIVADAAVELGLVSFSNKSSTLADPFSSTDANIGQLCQLLKSVGRDIYRARSWTHLRGVHTFSTVAGQALYAKPPDLDRIIDQTLWNRTTRLPLGGPLSGQEYEYFKARLVGVTFTLLFRELAGQFQVFPDNSTPGSNVIAYEYVSRWWVVAAAVQASSGPWLPSTAYLINTFVTNDGNVYKCTTPGTSSTVGPAVTSGTVTDGTVVWTYVSAAGSDVPTLSTDVIQFDAQMMMRALKLAFARAKGLPSEAMQEDFEKTWSFVTSIDSSAPILRLDRSSWDQPLLGERNMPLTGFGS